MEQPTAEQIREFSFEGNGHTENEEETTGQALLDDLMDLDSPSNDLDEADSGADKNHNLHYSDHNSNFGNEPGIIPLSPNRAPVRPVPPVQAPTPTRFGRSQYECRRLVLESNIRSEELRIKAYHRMCHSISDLITISDAQNFKNAERELQAAYKKARKTLQGKWKPEKQVEYISERQDEVRKRISQRKRWVPDKLRRNMLEIHARKKHPYTRDGKGLPFQTPLKRRKLENVRNKTKAAFSQINAVQEILRSETINLVRLRILSRNLPESDKPDAVREYEADISRALEEKKKVEDIRVFRILEEFTQHVIDDDRKQVARKGIHDREFGVLLFPTAIEMAEGYRRGTKIITAGKETVPDRSSHENSAFGVETEQQIDSNEAHSALVDRCEALANECRITEWMSETSSLQLSREHINNSPTLC